MIPLNHQRIGLVAATKADYDALNPTPPSPVDQPPEAAFITIKTHGELPCARDTTVILSNGQSLGRVQSVSWKASVRRNGAPKCIIETLLTPAELRALASDVVIRYQLIEDRTILPCAPAPKGDQS